MVQTPPPHTHTHAHALTFALLQDIHKANFSNTSVSNRNSSDFSALESLDPHSSPPMRAGRCVRVCVCMPACVCV